MRKSSLFQRCALLVVLAPLALATLILAQEPAAAPAKVALDHVLGAITAVDPNAHTITVLEDKTNTSYLIQLSGAKSFIKVEPGAKDLNNAQHITPEDLQVGDRVDARGKKTDASTLAARGLVLMSARDLQKAHQQQAAAWQTATAGSVSLVDAASGKITISARTAEGPKPITIETSKTTEFTRYSADNPKVPAASQLAAIETGDQIRIIGDKSADGASISAQRVYTGAFRTLSATIVSIAPDGKSLVIKDLSNKKPVQISLNDDSAVRKLPPPMATMLARRFNPDYRPPADAASAAQAGNGAPGNTRPANPPGANGGQGSGGWQRGPGGAPGAGGGMRTGDISQMLERIPKIQVTELKPGDALVVSGVALAADNSKILASSLIAGVEPILQSAPQRQNSVGGDWGLGEMSAPQ